MQSRAGRSLLTRIPLEERQKVIFLSSSLFVLCNILMAKVIKGFDRIYRYNDTLDTILMP
jgi:hypothetical protein